MITIVSPTIPIVRPSGIMEQQFERFVAEVTAESILIGTGTPEGNIGSGLGRLYMDDAGTTGTILYIKKLTDIAGDRTKGWILV